MKIAIATDHNGAELKKELIEYLSKKYTIIDCSKVNSPTDDYPDFAYKVAQAINNKEADFGILMCGTGIGMCITANKVKGIYCAHCSDIEQAHLAREHNDANVIAVSYKDSLDKLKKMIEEFLNTAASTDERHIRRRKKYKAIEAGEYNEH